MKKVLIACLFSVVLLGCDHKDDANPSISGTFVGEFLYSTPTGRYKPVQVVLTLSKSQFTGKSENPDYLGICSGAYELKGNIVSFVNMCAWQAFLQFPKLSGDFEFSFEKGVLEMTRSSEFESETYQLKRVSPF